MVPAAEVPVVNVPEEAGDWFAEPPFGGYQQRYRVVRRLHAERTDWQQLEIVDLEATGRTLLLDGTNQTSVGEEFTYHEPLVHVPMCAHPDPRRVLIIGGGDGGALRHVLLHPSVERAVESEIDGGVVAASLKYLPEVSAGAYDDPRAELRIEDGVKFLEHSQERFDVVIVDSTDPVGPAAALISLPFLERLRDSLASGGLVAMQSGSPLTQPREWTATVGAFRTVFPIVRPYLGFVPIYPGVQWSWVIGSIERDPTTVPAAALQTRLDALPERLRIYNADVHHAAFALPNYLRTLLRHDADQPLTEADLRAAGHPLPRVIRP